MRRITVQSQNLAYVAISFGEFNIFVKLFSDFNIFFNLLESWSHLISSSKLILLSNVWSKFLSSKCFCIFFKKKMTHSPRFFSFHSIFLSSFNWKAVVLLQYEVNSLNKPLERSLKRALVILTQCFLHSFSPSFFF